MIISDMRGAPGPRLVRGTCAGCGKDVYEALWLLDDAYNVWMGKCPFCACLNYLAMVGLRGYSSSGMNLVLPTDEEVVANNLPAGTKTRGSRGPATSHGSVSGEILHQLRKDPP